MTPTQSIDIERLRELASKATPGPWWFTYDGSSDWSVNSDVGGYGLCDGEIAGLYRYHASSCPDAEYIGSLSPDKILRLLDVIDIQRKALVKIRESAEPSTLGFWAHEALAEVDRIQRG